MVCREMIRSAYFLRRRVPFFQTDGVRALSYPAEPLDQPIPGLNAGEGGQGVPGKDFLSECQITRLENGLRVASQEAYGQYSTVGGEGGGEGM